MFKSPPKLQNGIIDLNKDQGDKQINILKEFKVKQPKRRRRKILDNSKNESGASVEMGVKKTIKKKKKSGHLQKKKRVKGKRRKKRRTNPSSSDANPSDKIV